MKKISKKFSLNFFYYIDFFFTCLTFNLSNFRRFQTLMHLRKVRVGKEYKNL